MLSQTGCAGPERAPSVIIEPTYNHNDQPEVVTQPDLIETPPTAWSGDVIALGPDGAIGAY